jgi:hypothetical protein
MHLVTHATAAASPYPNLDSPFPANRTGFFPGDIGLFGTLEPPP